MKHLLNSLATVFVALVTFASCQSNADLEFESLSSNGKETTNVITRSARDGFESYWDSLEPINWAELNSLEERFKYFNLPESEVKALSSETLLHLIVNYPLNYLILAYNKPVNAIKLVYEYSSIHKEFLNRDNAVTLLVDHFNSCDCSAKSPTPISEYNFVDELFLEYTLVSGMFDLSNEKHLLKSAIMRKLDLYKKDESMNSDLTLSPLYEIENLINYATVSTEPGTNLYNLSIYTPIFQELVGFRRAEMTSQQKIDLYNMVSQFYPNAIYRGPATYNYNCHSYAWYDNSTSNNVWLDAYYGGTFQLSKYWSTNDVYSSCSHEEAEKAYYPDGDHSVIVLGPDRVISKWGAWPLMEHCYLNCPYLATNIEYYKFSPKSTPYFVMSAISGNSSFLVETSQEFRIPKKVPGVTYVWSVQPMSSQSSSSYSMSTTSSGNLLLTCHEYGAYRVRADFYYKGNNISFNYIIAVATGSPTY